MELTVYFFINFVRITAEANIKWSILLGISSIILLIIIAQIRKIQKIFFPISFQEGNENNTLEIVTDYKLEKIENHESLIFFQSQMRNIYIDLAQTINHIY